VSVIDAETAAVDATDPPICGFYLSRDGACATRPRVDPRFRADYIGHREARYGRATHVARLPGRPTGPTGKGVSCRVAVPKRRGLSRERERHRLVMRSAKSG